MIAKKLTCVAIADTHGMYRELKLPRSDVLIHAGDITRYGRLEELNDFNSWLGELPHEHKIIIAGNHDKVFETDNSAARNKITNATYLQDEAITIDGIKFYGSPWQPWFLNWAFNLQRGEQIKEKWDQIPSDTDVLITHGPAYSKLDKVVEGEHVGCFDLVQAIQRTKPLFHVCGHIHEGYGMEVDESTTYINASVCTRRYMPINEPIPFTVTKNLNRNAM